MVVQTAVHPIRLSMLKSRGAFDVGLERESAREGVPSVEIRAVETRPLDAPPVESFPRRSDAQTMQGTKGIKRAQEAADGQRVESVSVESAKGTPATSDVVLDEPAGEELPAALAAYLPVGAREGDSDRATQDLAAVERVRAGDLDAFRELFLRYESRARAIAFGVVGNRDDAEDVVQEAFLKAYRNVSSFRGQSSFYTWFYRIVFNLAIDLSRKRYRKVESSLGESEAIDALHYQAESSVKGGGAELLGHIDGPEDVVNRADIRRSIATALDGLSSDHRAVIVLREIEGLSYNEISDVVGCSKGTVMSRLHHARRRMQKALTELLPWYEPSFAAGGHTHSGNSGGLARELLGEDENESAQHEYDEAE